MPGRITPDPLVIRLYDRVRHAYGLPEMPVLVADQIADQIDALPDAPGWSPPAPDYGCVAPPFRRTFVEATTTVDDPRLGQTLVQRGLALYALRPDRDAALLRDVGHAHRPLPLPPRTHWVLVCYGYVWIALVRLLHTFRGPCFVHLDREGFILDAIERGVSTIESPRPRSGPDIILGPPDARLGPMVGSEQAPAAQIAPLLPFALKAIAAMHRRCAATKTTPSASQQRQASHRVGGMQLHNYYTLQVKPTPTRDLDDFRAIGTPARRQAREHIVRGHFRIYSEERPLFGKHAGTYWVDEHDRGAGERIEKDYEVEP